MNISKRDLSAFNYLDKVRVAFPADIAVAIKVDTATEINRLRLLAKNGYIKRWPPVYGKKISYSNTIKSMNKIDSSKSIYQNRPVSYIHNIEVAHIVSELLKNNNQVTIDQFKLDSDFRQERKKVYHRPDIFINGLVIEIELNRKSPSRLKAILDWYQSEQSFKKIIYLTPLKSIKNVVNSRGGKFIARTINLSIF